MCPNELTRQFDMMPADLVSDQVLERIDAQLPKAREVKAPRLPDVLHVEHSDGDSTARRESKQGSSDV